MLRTNTFKSSCQEYKRAGYSTSGKYRIILRGKLTQTTCDMEKHGGHGWIVIQSRTDESKINFNRMWNAYKVGFGDEKDFWLGNEQIHQLTNNHYYPAEKWKFLFRLPYIKLQIMVAIL